MALRRGPIIIKCVLIGAGHKWTVYMLEIEEEIMGAESSREQKKNW